MHARAHIFTYVDIHKHGRNSGQTYTKKTHLCTIKTCANETRSNASLLTLER